jgi:hypothetical protein
VIITSVIVVLLLIAIVFANDFLGGRIAENEFSANTQFMLATSLQVDDIAWTPGRTQTIRYSSNYGHVEFQPMALSYSFEVDGQSVFTNVTGMIMYNMPISEYTLGNNYFERKYPSSSGSLLQQGPSAPVGHVLCVEKLNTTEGDYLRVVCVPSIRVLNSTIASESSATNYYKFYLPILELASTNLFRSQSVTMTGSDVTKIAIDGAEEVSITVTFPSEDLGYDENFFRFRDDSPYQPPYENSVVFPLSSSPGVTNVVEFYVGRVIVSLGQT